MLKQAFPDIPGYSHAPEIILMVRALKTLPPSLSLGYLPSPDNHRDEGRSFIYSNSTSKHHCEQSVAILGGRQHTSMAGSDTPRDRRAMLAVTIVLISLPAFRISLI